MPSRRVGPALRGKMGDGGRATAAVGTCGGGDAACRLPRAPRVRDQGSAALPTLDPSTTRATQDCVHRAIREHLLPFARRHYPELNAAFDKQPYPRPGNLFI
eukprot:5426535-Prymnesium_polylepis.1